MWLVCVCVCVCVTAKERGGGAEWGRRGRGIDKFHPNRVFFYVDEISVP